MFDVINNWLFSLSVMECIFLVLVFIGTWFYWSSPILRLVVIQNKLFGNGKAIITQTPIGLVAEILWYIGIYHFVTSFMAM